METIIFLIGVKVGDSIQVMYAKTAATCREAEERGDVVFGKIYGTNMTVTGMKHYFDYLEDLKKGGK